jgi:uncharacterized membrane protein
VSAGRWSSNPSATPRLGARARMTLLDLYYAAVNVLRLSLVLVGSLIIFVGIVRAALDAARGVGSIGRVARRIGTDATLGLEFFVGATLLNLILNPTWTAVATTALTIVVRTLLTVSLNRSAQ